MKILLHYESSSKIVEITNEENIYNAVERTFFLMPNSFHIKKFDKDFEEYVDINDSDEILNKDKFKIEKKKNPLALNKFSTSHFFALLPEDIPKKNIALFKSSTSHFSAFLPENTTKKNKELDKSSTSYFSVFLPEDTAKRNIALNESSTSHFSAFLPEDTPKKNLVRGIISNLKYKQWPSKILIPVEDFSKPLKEALKEKKELDWVLSKELIGHLGNYAYQYNKYPNKLQRQQICLAVVELFPHLTVDFGSLATKLMYKLKRIRADDNSLEVLTVRKNSRGSKTPKKVKAICIKGAINWAPDHFPGEDETSQAHHNQMLIEEYLKDEKYQNKAEIKDLMTLTYSFRREDINNKMLIEDIFTKYPFFFQATEQLDEFFRLTSVDIRETFTRNTIQKGAKLLQLFRKKKLNEEEKSFLTKIDDLNNNIDALHRRCEAEISYGIMIIPFLFREPMNSFFELGLFDDDTPNMDSVGPLIYGEMDFDGVFQIVIENNIVTVVKNFLLAVTLFMSYHYTLNISYSKKIENSFKFIQHFFLNIPEDCLPPKVTTLIKKFR